MEKASLRADDPGRKRFVDERENPGEEEGSKAGRRVGGGRFEPNLDVDEGSASALVGEGGNGGRALSLLGDGSMIVRSRIPTLGVERGLQWLVVEISMDIKLSRWWRKTRSQASDRDWYG